MGKKIVFGKFYPSNSIIHKLDPRVKLFAMLLYLVELFVFTDLISYIIFSAFLFATIILSKIPIKTIVGSKAVLFFILFISSFNLFWIDGHILMEIGSLTVTDKGIIKTIFISIRLLYVIISSSILMLTTTPNQLTDGMIETLKPLKKLNIPVHEMAMITSIMLRFIPVLLDEAYRIKDAQASRGTNFSTKKLTQKVKNYVPLFIPLFVSAFRHANELALAMEARGYRGDIGRTQMKPLKYQSIDYFAYSSLLLILVLLVVVGQLYQG